MSWVEVMTVTWILLGVYTVGFIISAVGIWKYSSARSRYSGETSGVITGVCKDADAFNDGQLDEYYESEDAVSPNVKKFHRVVEYTVGDVTYRKTEREAYCVKDWYSDQTIIRTVWFNVKNPGDFHLVRFNRA